MAGLRVIRAADRLRDGARGWAYAVGAVYHVPHGFSVDGIDPLPRDDFQQAMLERDWNIENREALIDQLNQLGAEGHRFGNVSRLRYYSMQWRPSVASMREELRAQVRDAAADGDDGEDDAGDAAANLWRLDAVQADLRGIRSSPLLAFDAARGVMLARAGLMLGWLGEEETWAYLIDLARDVQRTYPSWAAYGADFLLSRDVWRGNALPDGFDATVDLLTRDPASPWTTLPWDLPLHPPGIVRTVADRQPVWTLERR